MEVDYYSKYLKYKSKYLELKAKLGGNPNNNCTTRIVYDKLKKIELCPGYVKTCWCLHKREDHETIFEKLTSKTHCNGLIDDVNGVKCNCNFYSWYR